MLVQVIFFLWLIAIGLLLYGSYSYLFRRPPNFPNGPPRLPLLGGFAFMLMINPRHLHKAALKLSEYYRSKMVGIFIAGYPTVLVNDFEIMKEVMHRAEFDGRPNLFMAQLRERKFRRRGIIFTDGPEWKEQRHFMLHHLRSYGFDRRHDELETKMCNEIGTLIEQLKHGPMHEHEKEFLRPDGSAMAPNVFMACFSNVFLHVLSGDWIDRKNAAVLIETGKHAITFQRFGDGYGTILSMLPWMRYLFPNATNYNRLRESSLAVNAFIESIIQRHLASHKDGTVRRFIDLYSQEMLKTIPKEGDSFSFQYDQLVLGIVDFFLPVISGLTAQIALLLERLLLHPEIVHRMQAELDRVVGTGRLATLDDRINLPYTEATLRENMRIDSVVPSGIAHVATEDTKLRGYDIPKGTIMVLGIDAGHNQQNIWGDPQNFRPERFFDDRGKLDLVKDISVPFGAGNRVCAGETFARNMMFLVLAALVQNFNLKPVGSLPNLSERTTGVLCTPPDYWLKFEPR